MSSLEQILTAQRRLAGVALCTPLLHSPLLDGLAGRRILVKAESLQLTGAFKFRGAWSALTGMDERARRNGVLAYSSGNHGQAVALAARMHGIPAVIVMPAHAPAPKIDGARALGAEVVLYDHATESREEIGVRLGRERGLALVRPYDDPLVIAGQGTVGLEIAEQARRAGVASADVLVPCGGGGLAAGVSLALADRAPGLRPRPCEPEAFDDTRRSLAQGRRVANGGSQHSICDAIVTPIPGELTFPILRDHCGPGLVASDRACLQAMAVAFQRLRLVLEPGGAVALAAALSRPECIPGDTVIVVASGGNVDARLFCEAVHGLR